MRIIATATSKNEAGIIQESVREALGWTDGFVIYDNGSTDGTPDLAEQAGAIVLRGPVGEPWNEGLRQHMLDVLPDLRPDVVMRIDIDEIYHRGGQVRPPRDMIEEAFGKEGAFCMQAVQAEFWLTLDDVRRGALLEDERVSVQKRRRWYTIGHMAMVAWRHRPDLRYYSDVKFQRRRNVPLDEQGRSVHQIGPCANGVLLQKHYTGQSLRQVLERMRDRTDYATYGKYRYNIILDETIGLYYLGQDDRFDFRPNHEVVYKWYEDSLALYQERELTWKR
jgi:glycosyltransferase involved in cell wall biosynthesis